MFPSNGHYGHRTIVARYAGVPEQTPLPGLLQHGWNYDLGATAHDINLPRPDRFFTWNARNLARCKQAGIRHVASFGAPFLYMPAPTSPPNPPPRSLLAMPVHGWENERVAIDFAAYARTLVKLSAEFSKLTVCLSWFDHQFPASREPFEAEGFDVVTVGHRDNNPAFLFELRKLLLNNAYVTSNRAQTSVFYALALGRKTFLYGPPAGLDGRFDHSGYLFDAWQRQEYPSLLWDAFNDEAQSAIGLSELGYEFKKEPEPLREMLCWQPDQRAALSACVDAYSVRTSRGWRRLWYRGTGRLAAVAPDADEPGKGA